MPRGYMNMAESCVMTEENGIIINFYTPFEAVVDGVNIKTCGDYIADCNVKISIDFANEPKRTVKLRIPAWSAKTTLIVNGTEYSADSGYFTFVPENIKTDIEIFFDNSVKIRRIVPHPQKSAYEWKLQSYEAPWNPEGSADASLYRNEPACVLQKGALLLCRTKLIGNTEKEMFEDKTDIEPTDHCTAIRKPCDNVNTAYELQFSNSVRLNVCDYASGTNMMSDDKRFFSIYF